MKYAVSLFFAALLAVAPAMAQDNGPAPAPGRRGDMGDMMGRNMTTRNMPAQNGRDMLIRNMRGGTPAGPGLTDDGTGYLNRRQALGLTDDQVERLQALRIQNVRDTAQMDGELRALRLELQGLLGKDPIDLGSVESKINAINDLEAKREIAGIRVAVNARNILTDEQRQQLGALRVGRGNGMRGNGAGN